MTQPVDTPAVEAVIARVKAVYGRWRRDTPVAQMRADWDQLFGAAGEGTFAPLQLGGVPCAWITAPGVAHDQAIVYFHGGGFQVGSLQSHRELMLALSAAAGVRVLGVDYRLAPEHRYPAALDDALAVLQALRAQGFAAQDLALAGDSAGGGLALSTLLALQAQQRPLPAAAFTMSAWTDLAATGESYVSRSAADPIHQRPMVQAMARNYLGSTGQADDPLASPLYADPAQLRALPPLLLQVGDRETVLSDTERFAQRVNAAGGQATAQVWPGMVHVFQQFLHALPQARDALGQGGRFLASQLQRHHPGESRP
ncbi:alpha/beta hydrolase [Pseudorhodoferax sp. Leaf274]|uniref:alpha/beta hydrolase n=1 Tax=Pseudorhodoferax sp. Leaf274 TaxID=1736318 RepID=UPI000702B91A|nr:alpha/beta hydrolase [Pseudorhodoferax sp. Leaf274]KQP45636.1 esterase [Pseudorhodoferax sp. Leaf274]